MNGGSLVTNEKDADICIVDHMKKGSPEGMYYWILSHCHCGYTRRLTSVQLQVLVRIYHKIGDYGETGRVGNTPCFTQR